MGEDSRLKVAIVGDYPLNEEEIGSGVQSAMVNLVHGLAKTGKLEIHIIALKKGMESDFFTQKGSIHYHFSPRFVPYEISFILGINRRRILERLLEIKPLLVHAHDYEYSYLCVNPPCPIIITPHGIPRLESQYLLKTISRWRYCLHGVIAELLLARYGKNFILISEYSRRELKIPGKARVFIIPNAVRSDFFMLQNREVKGRLLFVAADVTPRKNPLLLLKAIAVLKGHFPHISLHLVGYFSNNAFHNSIKEFIRQNQMEQHVHFTGPLNDDQLMKEYEECSILALTSEWENLPVVIKQAMASGKVVIATSVGGVQEMIQDGTTGISIAPGDLDALINGLELLLRNDELRGKMGIAAKEEASKRFSEETVARKTLEAYQTVLYR